MSTREKITKNEWLESNGFNSNGISYLVLGNSYSIKDTLKEAGFKFSPLLRWHCGDNSFELPETCSYYKLNYEDIFTWDEENGITFMKEGTRDKLEDIFNPINESKSEYVGEVGEKIKDLPVTVRAIGGYDSAYGYKYVYTFEDSQGNVFSWFTTVQQAISLGMGLTLSGTIKSHSEYKQIKTTQMTRCKLGVLSERI